MARHRRRTAALLRAGAAGPLSALVAVAVMAPTATMAATPAAAALRNPAAPAAGQPAGQPPALLYRAEPSVEPVTPTPSPSESEASPSPTPSVPPPTLEPEPTTVSPPTPTKTRTPTQRPSPSTTSRPPGQPGVEVPGRPRLGVVVTTGDVRLGASYWHAGSTVTDLAITVGNTGETTGRFSLLYTLPVGVTDAGTPGCAAAGGRSYLCSAWTADAGDRWGATLRLRVAGDAWRRMPLMGSVQVTASASGIGEVRDNEGFAVLFPPGPPTPGISLHATEVNFPAADQPATLRVQLRNTGGATAAGAIEIVLPGGVSVSGPVDGCGPAAGRTRCVLGRLRPGQSRQVSVPLVATIEAQRAAPLSGAVFGTLSAHGSPKRMQMSFKITANESAATAPPVATATGSAGAFVPIEAEKRGMSGVQKTALALIVVSVLLVVLALVLAMTSLRRRLEDDPRPTDPAVGTD
jgi:hypothetical protein